jgi:hypothetical protein
MRVVPYQSDSSVVFQAPVEPEDTGYYTVYNVMGGIVQDRALATFVPYSDTLGAGASAGATALVVSDTTGRAAGDKLLLGVYPPDETTGAEWVTIKKVVDSTHLTLVNGLQSARVTGDSLVSTVVSFPLSAAATALPGRNYRIVWEWSRNGDGAIQPNAVVPFDVCRYFPISSCTFQTVRTLDPLAVKRVPQGTWLPDLLALSWDMVLRRIASKLPPGSVVGTIDLSVAHAYLTLVVLLEPGAGEEDTARMIERLERRFAQELDLAMSALSTDETGDGNAKSGEPGWGTHSIALQRR